MTGTCRYRSGSVGHAGGMGADAEDDWLEPDDQMGLWEYQLHPLTVGWLREALTSLADDVRVHVEFYNGTEARTLRPMHIDLKGKGGRPTAVVITVA